MYLKKSWILFILLPLGLNTYGAKKRQRRCQKKVTAVRKQAAKKQSHCKKVPPWTKRYQKTFTPADVHRLSVVKQLTLSSLQEGWTVLPFSQLIFSWNAIKPSNGYYRFSVRVRNSITHHWLPWHKAYEWGQDRQKSFQSTTNKLSIYNFVRLELHNIRADAFEIKIEAKNGASLKNIAMLSITTSHYKHMTPERVASLTTLPTVIVRGIPAFSQWQQGHPDCSRICSPTSTSMLVSYLTGKRAAPYDFAQEVHDHGLKAYGSWPFNTAHAFEKTEGKFFFAVTRLHSFKHLHAFLRKKIPVVVSVRGRIKNAPRPYPHGHLLVVIGYNARTRKVICHDPAQLLTRRVLSAYPLRSFLRAWEKSYRLAYITKRRPHYQSVGGNTV